MNLYINGSNRKQNCYKILNEIRNEQDKLISLSDKNIKYCLGCNLCTKNLEKYCIINDDMQEIYENILNANKIIIASPIYMNHITGILKNMIDRLNPFISKDILKDKKIYIITIGQLSEKENEDIAKNIKSYFESIGEIFNIEIIYLKNLSSKIEDDIEKSYNNYEEIINNLKEEINI